MTIIELEKDFFRKCPPEKKIAVSCFKNAFGNWGVGSLDGALLFVIGMKNTDLAEAMEYAQKRWGTACEEMDDESKAKYAQLLEHAITGRMERSFKLALVGTPFQRTVWKVLLKISCGQTKTYGDIAKEIGLPKAARAVGGAVGANSISVIVPCHRVLGVNGIGGYAWGIALKKQLLAQENAVA